MNSSIEIVYENYQKILEQKNKLIADKQNNLLSEEQFDLDNKALDQSIYDLSKNSLRVAFEFLKEKTGLELTVYQNSNNDNPNPQVINPVVKKSKDEFLTEVAKADTILQQKLSNHEINQEQHTLLAFAIQVVKTYHLADLEASVATPPILIKKTVETNTIEPKTFIDFLNKSMSLFTLYLLVILGMIGWFTYQIIIDLNLNTASAIGQGLLTNLPGIIWDTILATNLGIFKSVMDLTNQFGEASFSGWIAIITAIYLYLIIPLIFIIAKIIKPNQKPTIIKKIYLGYIAYGYATLFCTILFFLYTYVFLPDLLKLFLRLAMKINMLNLSDVMITNIFLGILLVLKLLITTKLYRKYLKVYFNSEEQTIKGLNSSN